MKFANPEIGKTSRKMMQERKILSKAFGGRHIWDQGYFVVSSAYSRNLNPPPLGGSSLIGTFDTQLLHSGFQGGGFHAQDFCRPDPAAYTPHRPI